VTDDLIYRIAMVGPTRVGKTSLITAVLADGQRLLRGTPVTLAAHGTPTERRIAQQNKQLNSALLRGEFNPGALRGTQEWFEFELALDAGVAGSAIRMKILDYPGEWLNPDTRRGRDEDWRYCKNFMRSASVLIIPVDAAVVMEANLAAERASWPYILTEEDVRAVVMDWAAARVTRPQEPAMLMICPIKCETYFPDNGGNRDDSAELEKRIRSIYAETLAHVPRHATTVYLPVDTIGCVELLDAEWPTDPATPDSLDFSARYRVRPPGVRTVKGAEDVLFALCRHLMDTRRREQTELAGSKRNEAWVAEQRAGEDRGFFGNFWMWLSGERELRRDYAASTAKEVAEVQVREAALREVVLNLAKQELGERVRLW
jgi:hypothetical protein